MKISDAVTSTFLCDWASQAAFLCDAFDVKLHYAADRNPAACAPLTLESVEALTEAEMQYLYDYFGFVYYPDLPLSSRQWFLWQASQLYRFWGTPRAIEALCTYILGATPIETEVMDNRAFDVNGNLVNEALLDTFSVDIQPQEPSLSEFALRRLIANIYRVVRNQEALKGISFTFDIVEQTKTAALHTGLTYSREYEMDLYL